MDIKPDLIKKETEFVDFTEMIVGIKSESEYDVSMNAIKTEKTSGAFIKQELDDDMWTIGVMKEVPEVKEEPSSNDDVEEKLPEIKTEEVMLKNESEDGDSETGANWENKMKDHTKDNKNTVKQYVCDHCDYSTHQKCLLKNHSLTTHNKISDKTYNCDDCDYKTHNVRNLKYHLRVMGNHDQMYCCIVCDYKTYQKGGLNRHIIAQHDKNLLKKHCCDKCNYRTFKKNDLDIHILVKHSKNQSKKFSCNWCYYSSHKKCHLADHMLAKHDKNAIKRYGCDQCDYRSHYKRNLHNHVVAKHDDSSTVISAI